MRPAPSRTTASGRRLRWSALIAGAALVLPATVALGAPQPAPGSSLRAAARHLTLDVGDVRPDRVHSVEAAAARTSSPDGPILPNHENADGIGPGSGLLLDESMLCTAAYLLEAGGTYYLSTAGHCLMKDAELRGPFDGSSANAVTKVEICFSGCRLNWAAGLDEVVGLRGEYVALEASSTYKPVAFAQAQDVAGEQIGYDFGLIRLPDALRPLLRPWMPQWGGPTGVQPPGLGFADTAVHFGHGTYCCPAAGGVLTRTELDQGRVAQFNFGDAISFEALAGSSTGGDSGSAVGRANPERLETKGVPGDTAVGVLTHGLVTGYSGFFGTVLSQGFELAAARVTGLRLVTEDESTTAQNTAPDAVDDTATTSAGSPVTIPVLANDVDRDGDTLQLSQVGPAANGATVAEADGTVTYTPADGFSGADSFTYSVSDGRGGTDTATVSITVSGNRAPDAVDDTATTRRNQPTPVTVLANDNDPDGDPLTVTAVTQPMHGKATLNRNGTITYQARRDYTGQDSFDYTISDGRGGSGTATVLVTVDQPGNGRRPAGW